MQAAIRGQSSRKDVAKKVEEKKNEEEGAAAVKMQAMIRGNSTRKEAAKKAEEEAAATKAEEEAAAAAAAKAAKKPSLTKKLSNMGASMIRAPSKDNDVRLSKNASSDSERSEKEIEREQIVTTMEPVQAAGHVLDTEELNKMLLMYGDLGKGRIVATTDEDHAAAKVQAITKGRQQRRASVAAKQRSSNIQLMLLILAGLAAIAAFMHFNDPTLFSSLLSPSPICTKVRGRLVCE